MATKIRKKVNCFRCSNKSSPQSAQILRFVLSSNVIETVKKIYCIFQRQLWPVWNVWIAKLYFSFAPLGGSVVCFFPVWGALLLFLLGQCWLCWALLPPVMDGSCKRSLKLHNSFQSVMFFIHSAMVVTCETCPTCEGNSQPIQEKKTIKNFLSITSCLVWANSTQGGIKHRIRETIETKPWGKVDWNANEKSNNKECLWILP